MTHANTNHPPDPDGSGGRRLYPIPTGDLADQMAAQVTRARAWLPAIDPGVFDCFLGELVAQVEPFTEADPVGVLASLLGSCGVHIGPDAHMLIGMERHPLVVWPMLIGPTGSGRKGTAWGAAKLLLTHAAPDFVATNVHSGLSSGEGLAAVFATNPDQGDVTAGGGGRKPKAARLLPDGDVRLFAYEPEWASVMARMKREGNTLSATLRAAWEGGNLSTLNVDARVARRGHVGILAHITPSEFKTRVSNTDMAGGTYNRFLPIAVGQSKFLHLPVMPDPARLKHLGATLAERLDQASHHHVLALSPAAQDAWAALYLEFGSFPEGDVTTGRLVEFTSRAAPHCLRIAAVYAALDGSPLIQPAHLTAAAALVRYSIASATVVLRPTHDLVKLTAWIAAAGEQGRTRKEVYSDFFHRNKTSDQVGALLDELAAAGRITVTQRAPAGGRGRPAEVYVANPDALNAVTH